MFNTNVVSSHRCSCARYESGLSPRCYLALSSPQPQPTGRGGAGALAQVLSEEGFSCISCLRIAGLLLPSLKLAREADSDLLFLGFYSPAAPDNPFSTSLCLSDGIWVSPAPPGLPRRSCLPRHLLPGGCQLRAATGKRSWKDAERNSVVKAKRGF